MSLRGDKTACIVTLLCAASTAGAKPTISSPCAVWQRHIVTQDVSACHDGAAQQSDFVTRPTSELAAVGMEILEPPAASAASVSSGPLDTAKNLPAVPGAVFMVLTGFVCVSLVRDKRVWLAALAGLLWAGQAGVQAVPQFARRVTANHIRQRLLNAELDYPYHLEHSKRLRSDLEGTRYIGLLHYLAGIPTPKRSLVIPVTTPLAVLPTEDRGEVAVPCLALQAEQFICFSPAFIPELIPRGPPVS